MLQSHAMRVHIMLEENGLVLQPAGVVILLYPIPGYHILLHGMLHPHTMGVHVMLEEDGMVLQPTGVVATAK
jgi:hypothetical protein